MFFYIKEKTYVLPAHLLIQLDLQDPASKLQIISSYTFWDTRD